MCAIVENTYIGFLIQNYYFVVCSCKKENSLGNSYCNNVQCFQLVDLIIKKIVNPGIKNWYILSISAKLKFQAWFDVISITITILALFNIVFCGFIENWMHLIEKVVIWLVHFFCFWEKWQFLCTFCNSVLLPTCKGDLILDFFSYQLRKKNTLFNYSNTRHDFWHCW